MKQKKTAFHFWSITGQRNPLMPKETKRPKPIFPLTSTPYCLNAHDIEKWHFIFRMKGLTDKIPTSLVTCKLSEKGKITKMWMPTSFPGHFPSSHLQVSMSRRKEAQEMKLPELKHKAWKNTLTEEESIKFFITLSCMGRVIVLSWRNVA